MNRKLIKLYKKTKFKGGEMLDTYNQIVIKKISCTITTRINASNEIWIVVEDEDKEI